MVEKSVYSAKEVSVLLNISSSKTYDLLHQAILPSIKVGRKFLIPKQRFEEWLNNPNS